jgi:hypothetical protein
MSTAGALLVRERERERAGVWWLGVRGEGREHLAVGMRSVHRPAVTHSAAFVMASIRWMWRASRLGPAWLGMTSLLFRRPPTWGLKLAAIIW